MPSHTIVSKEQWLEARKAHLAREKEFTRLRDQLSAERRAMPWVKVDKTYVFEGPKGKVTLADLFDGRRQLIVYHFMFGPGWEQGCPSCSFLSDHIDGAVVHLAHRDVTLVACPARRSARSTRSRSAWAGASRGCHRPEPTSTSIFTSRSRRSRWRRARWTTTSPAASSRARKPLASASSTRTSTATSSTRTPPMRADSICWSAPTTTQTSRRRAATRTPCRSRWRGCVTTIGTTRARDRGATAAEHLRRSRVLRGLLAARAVRPGLDQGARASELHGAAPGRRGPPRPRPRLRRRSARPSPRGTRRRGGDRRRHLRPHARTGQRRTEPSAAALSAPRHRAR